MKRIYIIIGVVLMAVVITSCGGQQKKGTKFAPQERTSSLSDSERQSAIDQKRAELLGGLNLDTLLYSHGVKFSIMQPKLQGEDITQDIADRISMKMLQMACQNGISGLGTNPGFVLGTEISQTGRAATATTPQKMTVQYELTFKVMNTATGDVYATATQEVMGVGNSFEEANQNFTKEIKNTPEIQKMMQTASQRIIEWYNKNVQTVKNQINEAAGKRDYALALAIASSVPEQAGEAYKYASSRIDELSKALLHKQAADMLSEMQAEVAANGESVPKYTKMDGSNSDYPDKQTILTENHNYEVGQICEKIGISRRMLYYYLESFRDWGFKVEKNGRYYSIDRQSPFFMHLFERINFTEDEALTLLAILNKVDDRNAITERIRHKLDRFYDLNILSHPEIREKTAHNVSVLYKAIKSKLLVKIIGYSSPHSKSVKDRIVEPFLLLNNNNEIRAYEYSSNMNKTFKVSRMDNVELLDLSWEHEAKHKQIYTDIFMFSGEDKQHIKLRLGLLSHNLMLEEIEKQYNDLMCRIAVLEKRERTIANPE